MSTPTTKRTPDRATWAQSAFRLLLGAFLVFAGTTHLTVARESFQAQVPRWVPLPTDIVVIASGLVELALGGALIVLPYRRTIVGWIVAAFFVAIFPGNVSQYVERSDSFGLDTDRARLVRLLFQPLLVIWALWATGAWRAARTARRRPGA